MNQHKYLTLVRRELREHRILWIAPLFALGLLIAIMISSAHLQQQGIAFDRSALHRTDGTQMLGMLSLFSALCMIGAISGLVAAIYALDCLHSERKDRSILFWKSLPVSDAQTVLSKFSLAVLLLPVGVFLLSVVAQPLLVLVAYLRFEPLRQYIGWDLSGVWAAALPRFALAGVFAILWYAPLTAWLMLASVLAKRPPLAIAVLPPVLLIGCEKLMFDSAYFRDFLVDRLFPWPTRLMELIGPRLMIGHGPDARPWLAFQDPGLWIGLAAAAGMLYIVIRVRRYRDDT